ASARQRRRAVALGAQEGNDVGALLGVGDAGEGHRRPRREGLWIGEPGIEQLVGPDTVLLMRLESVGVIEALDGGDLPSNYAVEVRSDHRGAAFIEGVARFAQSCVGLRSEE